MQILLLPVQILEMIGEDGSTIAIARAGTISVESLGFNQKDLEIIGNQELTRDKIDSIFFGYPLRSESAFDGDGIKEGNRLLKEETIYPLNVLIEEELTKSTIKPYWGENLIGRFADVRTADRALTIQENNVNSRWKTVDENALPRGNGTNRGRYVPRNWQSSCATRQ